MDEALHWVPYLDAVLRWVPYLDAAPRQADLPAPGDAKSDLRGCSDFLFVPGSNDCHVLVLRTEESLEGDLATYAAVIDLNGKVLMKETVYMMHDTISD